MEVYPIDNFGVVCSGSHVFCQAGVSRCEGIGKFLHIWQNTAGVWKIIRIVSYDHRAAPQ